MPRGPAVGGAGVHGFLLARERKKRWILLVLQKSSRPSHGIPRGGHYLYLYRYYCMIESRLQNAVGRHARGGHHGVDFRLIGRAALLSNDE